MAELFNHSLSHLFLSNIPNIPTLVENTDEIEEQMIFEEYKIWKKNAPFFYDTLYSHALTWPTLSCEWMQSRDV